MIDPAIISRIERLLAAGEHSQRKIARMTGVSRGAVQAIASGRRPDYAALARDRVAAKSPAFSGSPERCPGCGRLVLMPCLACRVGRLQPAERQRAIERDHGRPTLDLSEEDHASYERVRRKHAVPEDPLREDERETG